MEIFYTILYATFIGFYNIFKKQSVNKSKEPVVLVLFTTVAFLCSLIWIPFGMQIPFKFILIFMLKGFLLALSWLIVLRVLRDIDVSLVCIMTVISSVVTFILGLVVFKETTNALQIIGSIVIVLSVAGINLINKKQANKVTLLHVGLLILSALITTSSNVIDK